ncbi:Spt4/RpoE2 zinc finger-domain-containing protein [Xylariaceae sp. AK1471]|nr:Spt4/RpoE2 zinc finger-domain-containing protein [Xylariaceae sp. AK1471]
MERTWTQDWLEAQEVLQEGLQQELRTTSFCYSFCGNTAYSPFDLIDLQSTSTLLPYSRASDLVNPWPRHSGHYDPFSRLDFELLSDNDQNDERNNPLEAQHDDRMADNFVPPGQQRYTRACMVCSIVMTQARFRSEGCPNCPFLEIRGNADALDSCTSTVFEGLITVANPKKSWIAKWQRLDTYVPGVYATKVSGSIPEDIRNGLLEDGHVLIPRDGSGVDVD